MGAFYVRISIFEGMVELDRIETASHEDKAPSIELYNRLTEQLDIWGWKPERKAT